MLEILKTMLAALGAISLAGAALITLAYLVDRRHR